MVIDVVNAITAKLFTTFGNSYHYYFEDIEQGLKRPSFLVVLLEPTERSTSPVLYERTVPVVIHYFSQDSDTKKADLFTMAEQLMECVEYIPFGETTLRGENISWTLVDNVLELFITYNFITKRVVDTDTNMGELEETTVTP